MSQIVGNIPHIGKIIPHIGKIIPHIGEIIPHIGKTIPHIGKTIPHIGKIIPHIGKNIPHIGKTIPHIGKIIPHIGKIIPHIGKTIPHIGKIIPHIGKNIPNIFRATSRLATPPSGHFSTVCKQQRRVSGFCPTLGVVSLLFYQTKVAWPQAFQPCPHPAPTVVNVLARMGYLRWPSSFGRGLSR